MCQDSWYGPLCLSKANPCDSTHNKCSGGSTCVPLIEGYECDCPFGKTGIYCEKGIEIWGFISNSLITQTFFYLRNQHHWCQLWWN